MADTNDENAIRELIDSYVDAIRGNRVEVFAHLFHPQATMSIMMDGKLVILSDVAASIKAYMESLPPTAETSPDYRGEVVSVTVAGTVASAWVKEYALEGQNFDTYFHLHKEDGRWLMSAKATCGTAI